MIRASYSASLFETLKLNWRAYSITTSSELARMSPAPHPCAFEAPSMCKIHCRGFSISLDLIEDGSQATSDPIDDGSRESLDLVKDYSLGLGFLKILPHRG